MKQNFIEGIEGFEFISNGLRDYEFEEYISAQMYEYDEDVVLSATELKSAWITDANSVMSRKMEKYIAEFLHIPYRQYNFTNDNLSDLNNIEKEAVQAIYFTTQKLLESKLIKFLYVYRGYSWSQKPQELANLESVGQNIQLNEARTLSSWSFDKNIALSFANEKNYGIVVRAKFEKKQIFAIIDLMIEAESVCLSFNQFEDLEVLCICENTEEL